MNSIFQAKKISPKYGEKIIKLVYENPFLFQNEICECTGINAPSLSKIMSKMETSNLVVKEYVGRNVRYSLTEEVKKELTCPNPNNVLICPNPGNELNKTLFLNIIKCHQENPYVTYFLKDIEYTFACFLEEELIMLLFVLGICHYEEGQTFSLLFGLSDIEAVSVQQDLLNRFQNFLFCIIGKQDMPISEGERKL